MFIEIPEMSSVIDDYQLETMGLSPGDVRLAIMAAIEEARGYLYGKYDCQKIFSATGDDRHVILVEHCKSLAAWYLVRKSNTDLIFEQIKEYRAAAIDWFEKVAGLKGNEKPLAPDLPVMKDEDGQVRSTIRTGSRRKFRHDFDD